jgi:hypothetical protein
MNLGHDDGPCAPCAVSALPPGMTAGRDRAKLTLPMRLCLAMLPLLAGLAACGGGSSSTGFSSGMGSASATPGSTGSTSSTADSSSTSAGEGDNSTGSTSTSSGSAADSTPIFDMPIPDGGPAVPEGCKGKIDFLFVVSADEHDGVKAGAAPGELPRLHAGDRGSTPRVRRPYSLGGRWLLEPERLQPLQRRL